MDVNRRRLLIAIGALVLLAAIAGLIRWRHGARPVAVVTAAYAPFSIALPESGVVQYPQIQTMSSEVAGNIGQDSELDHLEERAIKAGASKLYIEDLTDEFVNDFIIPTLKAGAKYEGYLLGTSFALVFNSKEK